jgi:alpha-amylase
MAALYSPVSQNYQGLRTPYGDPYHGYWVQDISQLNERFGTSHDLRSLSKALHARDMYLMVDIVVNNVMAITSTPDYSHYFLTSPDDYHPICPIKWGDRNSEMNCWLSDEKVLLPDIKTEDPRVISRLNEWITDLVNDYDIDGLRIDGTWPPSHHIHEAYASSSCEVNVSITHYTNI